MKASTRKQRQRSRNRPVAKDPSPFYPPSTYNGWSSFETWPVSLWLDNDRGSYEYWRDSAKQHRAAEVDELAAKTALANQLNEEHEDAAAEALPSEPSVFSEGHESTTSWRRSKRS